MSSADLSACDIYDIVSPDWIGQRFPSGNPAFSRCTARELTRNREAWNFFELVESTDAATRLRICEAGSITFSTKPVVTPSLWYPITTQGRQALYERGRWLHIQLCPNYNWRPNRNRPFVFTPPCSATLVVSATQCPGITGAGDGVRALYVPIEYGEAASQGASEAESLESLQ
jgi:hypothetical protein